MIFPRYVTGTFVQRIVRGFNFINGSYC